MRQADLHARSRAYQAFVFDMDGVVTDTPLRGAEHQDLMVAPNIRASRATVHAAVWKTVLDEVLTRIGGSDQPPFDPVSDYRTYIDGRTREDGIRCFLAARGIKLPEGSRKDGPHRMTIKGLAARKQQLFAEEIARSAFEDAQCFHAAVAVGFSPCQQFTRRVDACELGSSRCGAGLH
jgi:beta-phosphoglucomutase-like phosphatase (HAD superfamily)